MQDLRWLTSIGSIEQGVHLVNRFLWSLSIQRYAMLEPGMDLVGLWDGSATTAQTVEEALRDRLGHAAPSEGRRGLNTSTYRLVAVPCSPSSR
jgi:hypothetical protein